MNGRFLYATTSTFLLIFLAQCVTMQPSIYAHFSQPDPCANAKSDWQTAKSTSDARKQIYNDFPAKATQHIAAVSAATYAVAVVKCRHLKKKKRESLYYSCVSGMVSAAVAAATAHAGIVLLQLRDDWIDAQKTTDAFYNIYLDCLRNNERDCDYDGSLDDCIKTTHTQACSCSDGYLNGRIYERPCPCEATHPH